MSATYLLDTTLLVYCFDEDVPEKKERALETIERTGHTPSAVLPAQALAKFSNVALYELEPPLSPTKSTSKSSFTRRPFQYCLLRQR